MNLHSQSLTQTLSHARGFLRKGSRGFYQKTRDTYVKEESRHRQVQLTPFSLIDDKFFIRLVEMTITQV